MKGIPIPKSAHYKEILKETHDILETFGIPRIKKYEALLMQYIYNAVYSEHFMEDVLIYLSKMADKTLTGDVDDFLPPKSVVINGEVFERIIEEDEREKGLVDAACDEIDAQRERKMKALQSLPRKVEIDAVRQYITSHLDFQVSDKELEDILTGFHLFWKYSNPYKSTDLDFQWAVDHYLTSMESPMDRQKMESVVDAIVEYLQENRLWGYPG